MIELRKTGDTCKIELEKSGSANKSKNAHVKMSWKTAVDLDLHAFAINSEDKFVHVSFAKKKSDCGNIVLDQDAGVGNSAGDNEENLVVHDLTKVKKLIFVANIFRFFGSLFSAGDKFNKYDGQIDIRTLDREIKVFLNSEELGRWAVIAVIENTNGVTIIKNVNAILKTEPNLEYLTNLN